MWYKFTIATSGTLTFVISPQAPYNADYDFAVYGPNKTCAAKGKPIRCNYAGSQIGNATNPLNQTGLKAGITQPYGAPYPESAWSSPMDVVAGETYYLIVSNWSAANALLSFSLSWGGTASLSSPFNDPSIQPYPFNPIGISGATPTDPRLIEVCDITAPYNFQSNSAHILNGNPNSFFVKYYKTANDALADTNAITAPLIVNTTDKYYYTIRYTNPNNPVDPANQCFNVEEFKFKDVTFKATNASITECNNNNNGVATYNLTATTLYTPNPAYTYIIKYYPTIADANNGTNEITNPMIYTSAAGDVYAKITTNLGCSDIAKITLKFYADITVIPATMETCYIESNPSTGLFDLTQAVVTPAGTTGLTKKYYPSKTDAINSTNEITNPTTYISPSGQVTVKVITNSNNCYNLTTITLKVNTPVKSNVLQNKQICIENTTTLDAGPGFAQYQWSTGETTSSISNVGIGTYWVRLKTRDCWTKQEVKVYPAELPVISNVNIGSTSISVDVVGGTPPYVYSMDKFTWQSSNTFENLPRGVFKVYVKDSNNCSPVEVEVTIPNIINVITPNGDGVNDVIDYSSLSMKKDLTFKVYDRYGAMIYQADKNNGYKWDGTINGKKLTTGTYWYSVTWKENDLLNTPVVFSGWVLLKNRD